MFFTKLPRELRDHIYGYLLKQTLDIEVGRLSTQGSSSLFLPDGQLATELHPTILRSCQKVYHEAISTLYRENQFLFQGYSEVRNFAQEGIEFDADACKS